VTFRDGSPSQVTIIMDVDNGALRFISGGIERVRRDMLEAASSLPGSSAEAAAAPSGSSDRQRRTPEERVGAATSVMDAIADGLRRAGEVLNPSAPSPSDRAPAPAPGTPQLDAKGAAMQHWRDSGGDVETAYADNPWKTGVPWYLWALGGVAVAGGGYLIYRAVKD
jgi:hypothetical protein